MRIKLLLLTLMLSFSTINAQQITELWTNYDGLWSSSDTSINPVRPDDSHELLAFRYGATIFSTGVDDLTLTNNSISYTPEVYRALPLGFLPTTGGGFYYVGLGQLADGINNGTDNSSTNPFNTITNGNQVANFLTDGINGLDLGTNITNIPQSTITRFSLSSNGISLSRIDDNIPDIIVSQTALPSGGSGFDRLFFVDSSGSVVGNVVTINFASSTEPALGNWNPDFYNFNSTGNSGYTLTNGTRSIHLKAIEITAFGIGDTNYQDAVELRYEPRGSSDPSFIAFNEPSLGVASQLNVLTQPTSQNCDGTLLSDITVQLEDDNGAAVPQDNIAITASLYSGPGELLGTLTKLTNTIGVATFDDLSFSIGTAHRIEFNYASLNSAVSDVIEAATGCTDFVWNGNTDSQWNVATNWTPNGVPNGNNKVTIPNSRPNYPILTADAGAGELVMSSNATINVNGYLFAINGDMLTDVGAKIDASSPNSTLHMSSNTLQNIPADLLETSVANFVVENEIGVTLNSKMDITESLSSLEGAITTGGFITMKCSFSSPSSAAVIKQVKGSISGNITTEQCFPEKRAFRMLSPSVTTLTSIRENWQENPTDYLDASPNGFGTHITGVEPGSSYASVSQDGNNGFDYNPSGNPSIFIFDNATQSWEIQPNTTTNLVAGQPYRLMIRGDRTIDITSNATQSTDTRLRETGVVETGVQTITGLNSTFEAFNFVGNPYHAQVDLNTVLNNSTNVNAGVVYFWDPTINTRGGYVTVDLPDGINSVGSDATNILQVKQAVFVLTNNQGIAPFVVFEETDKIESNTQLSVFSEEGGINRSSYINVQLFSDEALNNSEKPYDGIRINFSDKFSNTIEDDYAKMGNLDENLTRLNDNYYLAIEYREMPVHEEVLDLFVNNYRTLDYSFVIESEGDLDKDTYLVDEYLDEEIEITSSYFAHAFSVNPNIAESIDASRFKLKFKNVTLGTENPDKIDLKIYPNPVASNSFEIQGLNPSTDTEIIIYDNLGREVFKHTAQNQSKVELNKIKLETGIYFVKVIDMESSRSQSLKLIVE
ncbi:T9SS type A sorting domain-containing protein [Psychroflexus halocasei]|uniref:Por secretion system C-terminal sorting domain-containing protein n=1 Tax=Psychroflexus halocasei TaxID=908615 RepID=A0A1H4DAU5_9FLAO|nr:T9SS type A sorting domain-containing protein [Psychroflexus halocasei]SEA69668.1 Por secretion system C-terminal sorting domain-containing protein [Psychroflexus halocasei]